MVEQDLRCRSVKSTNKPASNARSNGCDGNSGYWHLITAAVAVTAVLVVVVLASNEYESVAAYVFDGSSNILSDKMAKDSAAFPRVRHAVMIDAGSTGSRVLVFTFWQSSSDANLVLMDEFFKEVTPGISSYASNPEKAALSIQGLLDDAKKIVPSNLWATTTVSLKATAGLRLLPSEMSENLLNVIRDVFATSGFLVSSNAVSVIDGNSEGLYSWMTINFLLGKTNDLNESVVITDMGGASTQLAFVPLSPDTFSKVPPEDVSTISAFGKTLKFYIHSYLGMGLMAMRLTILRATNETNDHQGEVYFCPYISESANFTWEFQGTKYNIRGIKKADQGGPNRETAQLIKYFGMRGMDELKNRTLFAVSYFYDRAVEAGLIDEKKGGSISVGDFCSSASKACGERLSTEQPFACIDYTYICTLLRNGFALSDNKVIQLQKKIDGHETSWALGAALSDLHTSQKR